MSDTAQMLNFQRYQALEQLNKFHDDEWNNLCEKHSIESKALETSISRVHESFTASKEGKSAQIKTLAACQQNELDKITARHVIQSLDIKNSDNPLNDFNKIVGKHEQDNIKVENEKSSSPFENINSYKDLAQNNFNEVSNPLTQEQSTDMER